MLHFKENNITVFQSVLYKTTATVIESQKAMIIVDPNWLPNEIAEIRNFVNQQLGHKDLYVIYTHSDFDHIIGSGVFPEAKVIATEKFNNHPNKEKIIKKIYDFDQEYYIARNYRPTYPKVDIPITKNGQKLDLGDLTLTFYKAPGHTDDSLFTVVEPLGIFLAGDYLSDVEFPFIYSGFKDYVNTMDLASTTMDHHDIKYLIPGHGSVTKNRQDMLDRISFSKHYLHELLNESSQIEKECQAKFQFFSGMKDAHDENKKMAKEENQ